MNQEIMNLISDDRYLAGYVYQMLRKEWPQINEATKVALTNQQRVYIGHYQTASVMDLAPEPDTLSRWWKRFFSRRNLDNPEIRWQYQMAVFHNFMRLPLVVWKAVNGQVRREIEAYRKSMIVTPVQADELMLRKIQWQQGGWFQEVNYLICAYHSASDTFYVYKPAGGRKAVGVPASERRLR